MAMLAGSVLVLIIGTMLVSVVTAWVTNSDEVKQQEDASIALFVIGRDIRESSISDIRIGGSSFSPGGSGNLLEFAANGTTRSNRTWVAVSGNRLLYQPDGFILVNEGVNHFSATFNSDTSIDIALHLQGGGRVGDTTLNATFFPRN